MSKPLGILELLNRVGEDNIAIQNVLTDSFIAAKKRKGGFTEISFGTDAVSCEELMLGRPKRVGLMVWMPADLVEKAKAEHAAESGEASE